MLILGVLLAILSNIVYPLSFALIRKVEDKVNPVLICTIRIFTACCFFLLFGLISGFFRFIGQISANIWVILFASILGLDIFGDIAYFNAQKRLGTTKAITVAMSYPLFTMLFAFPLLHQPWKWPLFLSAIVISIGIYFLSPPPTREPRSPFSYDHDSSLLQPKPSSKFHFNITTQGFLLALITAILWALGTIATEYGLVQVENTVHLGFLSSFVANLIRYPLGVLFIIPLERIAIRTPLKKISKYIWIWLLSSSFLSVLGIYLYGESIRLIGASIYALLSAGGPLFAYPITFFLNKERLTWRNLVGVIIVAVGISLIFL